MTRFALTALVAIVAGAAPAADPVADEMKKLQGEWRVVEVEAKGQKVSKDDADAKNMRFVIKDTELTVGAADGSGAKRQKTFKVDPAKNPRHIDITSLDGQEKGTTAAGIYQLVKDRLTICMPYFTNDISKRPTELKVNGDDGLILITLERIKPK